MPILVANTWAEELAAMTAHHVTQAEAHSASRWESEPWDLLGFRVSLRLSRRRGRGRKPVLVREYLLNGRRKGYNALLGALKKRELAMLKESGAEARV